MRPRGIAAPWHCGPVALWPRGIATPWHYGPVALWPRGIMAPWHCGPVALRPRGIMAPWHYGPVALWPGGIMAPWHCGLYPVDLSDGCSQTSVDGATQRLQIELTNYQAQRTVTDSSNPTADLITPGTWQGSHCSTIF